MGHTSLDIAGELFSVNGGLTYSEIEGSNPAAHGLLMNARFIQGVFDDKSGPERFARFGYGQYDPEAQTDRLVKALPEWYRYGLRAFTVGLQGGGPVFTVDDWSSIDNNPFSEDGKQIDAAYFDRLDRLIRGADELGMIVIVSLFYQAQIKRLADGAAVVNALTAACSALREADYRNVIIEVANEHDVGDFRLHPLIQSAEGVAHLIGLARAASGGLPVGSSLGGGRIDQEIGTASDVILIHGNDLTRQEYYNMIKRVRAWGLEKPVVCNEDSPCMSQLSVAFHTRTSWGYYNNLTKQEPPTDWSVTPGEDTYFARRMAEGIGIALPALPLEEQFRLQGLDDELTLDGRRWIRLASLYPETIDYVEFLRNSELVDRAYNDPFMMNNVTTWIQEPTRIARDDDWKAIVHLADGSVVEKVPPAGA